MTDDRRRIVPSLIGMLHDVDTSTTPPAAGDTLVWDDTAKKWKPGSSGSVAVQQDYLTSTATGTTVTLGATPIADSLLVWLNGTPLLEATGGFSLTGAVVTVNGGFATGDIIRTYYLYTGSLGSASLGYVNTITDDFNRANSFTTINNASDGGTWTVVGGTWGISSNHGYLVSTTGGALYGPWYVIRRDFGFVAQDFTVTSLKGSASTPQLQALQFAWDPTVTAPAYASYEMRVTPDGASTTVQVFRARPDGVTTQIGTDLTCTPYTSSVFRVTYNPATGAIKVWQDGTLLGTRTDTSPLTGSGHTWVGLAQLAASGTEGFDDFNVV